MSGSMGPIDLASDPNNYDQGMGSAGFQDFGAGTPTATPEEQAAALTTHAGTGTAIRDALGLVLSIATGNIPGALGFGGKSAYDLYNSGLFGGTPNADQIAADAMGNVGRQDRGANVNAMGGPAAASNPNAGNDMSSYMSALMLPYLLQSTGSGSALTTGAMPGGAASPTSGVTAMLAPQILMQATQPQYTSMLPNALYSGMGGRY